MHSDPAIRNWLRELNNSFPPIVVPNIASYHQRKPTAVTCLMKGGSEAIYIELCYVQRPRITLEAKKITRIQGVLPNLQNPFVT